MKIGIVGATRGIGYALLTLALEEGHDVTVLARDPKRLKISDPRLKVIQGDIVDPGAVALLVKGQDAICSCIGIMPTWKPVDVFSRGAANVLLAMGKDSKQKYVAVTGIGAGDSKDHGGFLYDRLFNPLFLKSIYVNKNREEALIMVSRIQWMIVRIGCEGSDEYPLNPVGSVVLNPEVKELVAEIRARRSGELFLFVNDAVLPIPGWFDYFYRNNHGQAIVTVKPLVR